jgi:hypothetical protein
MQQKRILRVAALCLVPVMLQASIVSARLVEGGEGVVATGTAVLEPAESGVRTDPPSSVVRPGSGGEAPRMPRIVSVDIPPLRELERGEQPVQKLAVPEAALCPQWWELAREVGWEETVLRDLDVILHRESRCLEAVHNREDPNGGSRGLAQINGSWTKWLRERGILVKAGDLFDPRVNLEAALAIYRYGVDRYGFGWGPWGFRYVEPHQE